MVKVPAAHTRAYIAGRLFDIEHVFENVRFENGYGYIHRLGVFLYHSTVFSAVTGVHYEKSELERNFVVPFELLKELCHQEGILPARHTHGDFIVRPDKPVLDNGFRKARKQLFTEFFTQAFFADFRGSFRGNNFIVHTVIVRAAPRVFARGGGKLLSVIY